MQIQTSISPSTMLTQAYCKLNLLQTVLKRIHHLSKWSFPPLLTLSNRSQYALIVSNLQSSENRKLRQSKHELFFIVSRGSTFCLRSSFFGPMHLEARGARGLRGQLRCDSFHSDAVCMQKRLESNCYTVLLSSAKRCGSECHSTCIWWKSSIEAVLATNARALIHGLSKLRMPIQICTYLCFLQLGLFNHVAAVFHLIIRFKLSLTHFSQDSLLTCQCVH